MYKYHTTPSNLCALAYKHIDLYSYTNKLKHDSSYKQLNVIELHVIKLGQQTNRIEVQSLTNELGPYLSIILKNILSLIFLFFICYSI